MSVLLISSAANANDYSDARAELVTAYQQQDYPAMQLAAQKALAARPGFPGAMFNLALSYTLNGRHQDSLRILRKILHKGIDFAAVDLDEFSALRALDSWSDYQKKVDRLNEPFGAAEIAARHRESNFIPEGIAMDRAGQIYLGSIRTGQLLQLAAIPKQVVRAKSHWSVFGMRFDDDGDLWFASAAVPQFKGVGEDAGKTGLFRVDVSSGTVTRSALLPPYEKDQVLGDLVIVDANTIYTTDSLTGAIYRYYIDSNEYETLVERGKLGSPQGLVLDKDAGSLYVADYTGGLYRVSLQDGSLVKLQVPDNVSDYGVDGLYRYGSELVVVQNGIRPHRVAALRLDDTGLAITGSRVLAADLEHFDEPTLGFVRGDDFYFVANSHWNRFDQDNELPEGLAGPIILRVSLK